MRNYKKDFDFGNTIWLNCSHQGPLPKTATNAIEEAIRLKKDPSELKDFFFDEVPVRLKKSLGKTTINHQVNYIHKEVDRALNIV